MPKAVVGERARTDSPKTFDEPGKQARAAAGLERDLDRDLTLADRPHLDFTENSMTVKDELCDEWLRKLDDRKGRNITITIQP